MARSRNQTNLLKPNRTHRFGYFSLEKVDIVALVAIYYFVSKNSVKYTKEKFNETY